MKLGKMINNLFLLLLIGFMLVASCENMFLKDLLPKYPDNSDIPGETTFTVTFDKNGGDTEANPAYKTVTSPETTIDELPIAPTRIGFNFVSWNTQHNGNGDVFNESTTVTEDITVYAIWVSSSTPPLGGSAEITGTHRIGQLLSVNTSSVTNIPDSGSLVYQWKRDSDNIPSANSNTYTVQGIDAGKVISCSITHTHTTGSITAIGETVFYEIEIITSGKEGTDSVSVSPEFGYDNDAITINYILADTKANNQLTFSGVSASITVVTTTGTGTRTYTINESDASNGIITINAVFIHSDKIIDAISFADSNNETRVYGDAAFTKAITSAGNGSGAITYSSSNTDVATVNSSTGAVTILKVGTATITAIKAEDESYSHATASYQLTVNPKPVTITGLTAQNKIYDGTVVAIITGSPSVIGKVGDDNVSVTTGTGTFNNRNAGIGKTITLTGYTLAGTDKDNYILSSLPSLTANITQRQLEILNPVVTTTRSYNGSTTAEFTGGTTAQLTNKIEADTIAVSAEANYNSANVLTANLITVVFNITGADALNYIKPVDYTIAGTITKATGREVTVPVAATITKNSITVNAVTVSSPTYGQIAEYAIAQNTNVPSSGWQEGRTFNGLMEDTNYYVFARSKGNDNVNTGIARMSAVIKTLADGASDIPRFTIVDFEADSVGKTYSVTGGGGNATATVVADPVNSGQKSLQVNSNNYNRAAIIPINLPYDLENYKSFAFRFRLSSGTIDGQTIMVYAAGAANQFLDYGFGNPSNSQYAQFANLMIGETAPLNISSTPTGWTNYTITINNPGTSIKNLQGNIFIAIGINRENSITYQLDDLTFTMKDDFDPPPPPPGPPTHSPAPPSVGAINSGNYRNMYLEYGKTQEEIDAKVDQIFYDLFTSTATGDDQTRIYYPVSIPGVGDGAYILDSGDYNDVRSEGMSYGMMMAVQLDKKTEFDRLWRWAKTYMYNTTNAGRNMRGYFTWAVYPNGTARDVGIAPDGEFYFATALLFASARWGDNTGSGSDATMLNYRQHAMQLLYDMINRNANGSVDPYGASGLYRRPGDAGTTLPNTLLGGYHQPVFSPYGNSQDYTDPSYFLPAFNEIWAMELEADANAGRLHGIWSSAAAMREDAAFYKQAAVVAREFFKTTVYHPANPYSDRRAPTYLGPDYSEFNGLGRSPQAHFLYDAWRIAMNIAFDYAWFAEDPWQKTFADGIQAFFKSKGVNSYGSLWYLDGTLDSNSNGGSGVHHSPGLVACNAVTSLASTTPDTWLFLEDFWNAGLTKGQWRYYDGCLYMLGLLHVTGNFKAYLSTNTTPTPQPSITPTTATFNKYAPSTIQIDMTLNDNTLQRIENNDTTVANTNYTLSNSNTRVTFNTTYLNSLPLGTTTLTFVFSPGSNRNLVITVVDTTPSASISPTTAVFDKNTSNANYKDITVNMTLNGYTFSRIQNNSATLVQNTDYTVTGTTVTIKKEYLEEFENGSVTLTFVFSGGNNQTLVISIGDSGGVVISYDFSVNPGVDNVRSHNLNADAPWEWISGTPGGTTDVPATNGVLQFRTTQNNTSSVFFKFNLGTQTLQDFSGIEVQIVGIGTSYKSGRIYVVNSGGTLPGTDISGQISNSNFIANSNQWYTRTITFNSANRSDFTGEIEIGICVAEADAQTYQIKSVRLIP